ncbi:MAG TPA: addiction module antidote protein, HigA family [Rhizobiales bacterium]|nr:addiction module antidote protein, HigA family [Hyphomicrobiales bacterium]
MTRSAFEPVHPGRLLRDDVLPALGLNVTKAAKLLGVSRQTLHKIMREDDPAAVTPDMAARLGKLCGNGARLWMNMQVNYWLWHAEQEIDTSGIPTLETKAA